MHIALSLPEDAASPWMELFASALPEATLARHEPDKPAPPGAQCADYVVAAYPSKTLFVEQPAPKAVFTVSAGVGHALALPNLPRHVPLIRVEDAGMAAQMVRYALTAAMRVTQRLDTYRRQQHEARWVQHSPRGPAQMSAGVMGLGVIGSAIARALAVQGFKVRGYALHRKELQGIECYAGAPEFAAFLSGLDLVVGVLPATAQTAGLLDRDAMMRLSDGAHVVNIGRGDLVVEDDLLALLDAGKLSGATLDVFREEPLPPSHPFWRRAEITVTPHVAGLTIADETVAQVAGKIRALERGETVSGVVDFERGY
jgi:glyoxylate/hydroxypyruvate reductase A